MTVIICRDADDLGQHGADLIVESARRAVADHGRFSIALSGGKTPERIYSALAQDERRERMPWDKTYVFVSDERMTPLESADSNFGNARRALLANVPIPGDHLFVAKTEEATGREAAMAYERSIADFFGVPAGGACPRFDLILLGMGDDGHTASLFPGMSTLSEKTAWVVASPPGILPPPLERITFTYPLINAAQEVVVLVSGRGKANVLHALFDETPSAEEMPAAGIAPVSGNLIWLIDEPASQLLTGRE